MLAALCGGAAQAWEFNTAADITRLLELALALAPPPGVADAAGAAPARLSGGDVAKIVRAVRRLAWNGAG